MDQNHTRRPIRFRHREHSRYLPWGIASVRGRLQREVEQWEFILYKRLLLKGSITPERVRRTIDASSQHFKHQFLRPARRLVESLPLASDVRELVRTDGNDQVALIQNRFDEMRGRLLDLLERASTEVMVRHLLPDISPSALFCEPGAPPHPIHT